MDNTKQLKNKKKVSLTREVKDFIIDKMCSGLDISNICKKYEDKVPAYETIIRASTKDREWAEEVDQAYTVLLMRRLDELDELADENWCRDRLAQYDGDYKLAFEARRTKLDTMKFVLGKMAPILSNRFNKPDTLKVEHQNAPQLVVMNWSTPKQIEGDIIDHE